MTKEFVTKARFKGESLFSVIKKASAVFLNLYYVLPDRYRVIAEFTFYLLAGLAFGFAVISLDRNILVLVGAVLIAAIMLLIPGRKFTLHWMLLFLVVVLPICGLAFIPALHVYRNYLPPLVSLSFITLLLVYYYDRPGFLSTLPNPFAGILLAYIVLMLLSVTWSVEAHISLLLVLRSIVVSAVFLGLLPGITWQRRQIESLFWALVGLGVLFSLLGLLTAFVGPITMGPFVLDVYEYFYAYQFPRIASVFLNPNSFSIFLVYSLAATLILTTIMLFKKPLGQQSVFYIFLIVAVLIQLTAFIFTFSRSSYLALLVFLALFIYLNYRRLFYFMVVMVLPAIYWILANYLEYMQTFLRIDRLLAGRDKFWSEGLELIRQSNYAGIGLGGWQVVTEWGVSVHNSYLRVAIELGIIGLLIYLGMILSLLVLMARALRRCAPGSSRRIIISGILALSLGLMITMFFEVFLIGGTSFLEIYYVLMLSLGISLSNRGLIEES